MINQDTENTYTEVILSKDNYSAPHMQLFLAGFGVLIIFLGHDMMNSMNPMYKYFFSYLELLIGSFALYGSVVNTINWIFSKLKGTNVKAYIRFFDEYLAIGSTGIIQPFYARGFKVYHNHIDFVVDFEYKRITTVEIHLINGKKKSFSLFSDKSNLSKVKGNFRKRAVEFD